MLSFVVRVLIIGRDRVFRFFFVFRVVMLMWKLCRFGCFLKSMFMLGFLVWVGCGVVCWV